MSIYFVGNNPMVGATVACAVSDDERSRFNQRTQKCVLTSLQQERLSAVTLVDCRFYYTIEAVYLLPYDCYRYVDNEFRDIVNTES